MFRLTLKNLRANKIRFALTTFGVTLAVSFVVAAFVLADGLRSTFTDVADDITAGIDLEVRPVSDFGDPDPLPVSFASIVANVDGVTYAAPNIEAADNSVRPFLTDGSTITTDGPPQLAYNWIDNEQLSPFSLVDGAAPAAGQFTVDFDSADEHNFVIGDSYEFVTPTGRHDLTLSGTSSFGPNNDTVGATLMQMNTAEAGALFGIDGLTGVHIEVAENADIATVQSAIALAVPTAEVVDNETIRSDTEAEFTGQIDIIGNILLGFGGVALFVSIFIIYNTFAIVVGQRVRELALLRTIGADPKQIRRSVLGEALVIGTIASAAGLLGGIAVSKGLEALFSAGGAALPDAPLIVSARTIIAAVAIGLGVTMFSAIGPARRASTVPAIAALNGGAAATAPGSRTRITSGTGLIVSGIVVGGLGLTGVGGTATTIALMALGAIAVFVGVTLLSPMAVGFITRTLGWPLATTSGVAGRLAQQNAARNPRRTATTAAALMIGLTLVSTALVVGASVKSNIASTMERAVLADYMVTTQTREVEFPTTLAWELAAAGVVDSVTGFRYVEARVGEDVQDVVAADFTQVGALLDLDMQDGGYDTATTHPVIVGSDHAASAALMIGDVVTTSFANGNSVEATIVGTFADQSLIRQDFMFDTSVYESANVNVADEWLAIGTVADANPTALTAALGQVSTQFPQADVETAEQFRDRIEGVVDELLAIVNVMVALAVIIALIGIANTLALSVFERTRELGLVRAVGMSRRQLRRMVRFEAGLVATFGAVLGVGIGLLFGFGVVQGLPDSFASAVSIPVGSIVTLVAVAAAAGVVAAWLPARRAGRLDILEAISAQ
ncbi:MAG: putative ABC transport system permease protein [Minisyncoccia bacterium]|jgi:putative ABC transport system permease protein